MWKRYALSCLLLLTTRVVMGVDDNPDAKRLMRELPSTWECVPSADQPKEAHLIKHVTPMHWTWLAYDGEKHEILAVAGGTWTLKDGKYEEKPEFATDDVRHLRGKTFQFTIKLVGDKWDHKGVPGTEIDVDQVWTRLKPSDQQKKITDEAGRQLRGTWETAMGPGAPKSLRIVKHVTPTHWTWVVFDRETRRVAAAAGGTWTLRDGEYVETCDFSSENFPQARGNSYAFEYKVDGDQWLLKGGPNRAIRDDQTWKRLK